MSELLIHSMPEMDTEHCGMIPPLAVFCGCRDSALYVANYSLTGSQAIAGFVSDATVGIAPVDDPVIGNHAASNGAAGSYAITHNYVKGHVYMTEPSAKIISGINSGGVLVIRGRK